MILKKLGQVLILTIVFMAFSVDMGRAQDEPSAPVLDVIFALDVSGSMDVSLTRNNYPAIDRGLHRLNFSGERPPTDPEQLRFSTTDTLLEWLSAYGYQNTDRLTINAQVMSFDDTPQTLMEWQTLRRADDNTTAHLSPLSQDSVRSTTSNSAQNSNFVALYEAMNRAFSGRPNAQRAVILVTDSVPCYPVGVRDPSLPLYDPFCDDVPSMRRHIQLGLASLGGAVEHVIFINPLGSASHWNAFPELLAAWQTRVNANGGSFREISSIDDLPATMIDAVLREMGIATGAINPQNTQGNEPVNNQAYLQMGVNHSTNRRFNVAPFQSYIDVLMVMPTTTAPVNLSAPGNVAASSPAVYGTADQRVRIVRVVQPAAGPWTANSGLPTDTPLWALSRTGNARLTVNPSAPSQYDPVTLRYELVDHTGTPFTFTDEVRPEISLSVRLPGASDSQDIDLSAVTLGEGGQSLITPELLALSSGPYTVRVEVRPGQGGVWNVPANYDFLQPSRLPSLNVVGVTFNVDYEVSGRIGVATDTDTTITMPRSLPLEISLRRNDNRELPQGLQARIVFSAPDATDEDEDEDQTCPSDPLILGISPESRTQAVNQVRFEQDGVCRMVLQVELTSVLPPLEGSTHTINTTGNSRTVTITPTQRLSFRLMTPDGETPLPGVLGQVADFSLVNPVDFAFTPNQLTLWLEVRDENGQLVEPIFLEGETTPNAQVCRFAGGGSTPTVTDEGEPAPTVDLIGATVVPFYLAITNDNQDDIAAENGICFAATGRAGVYLARISGLSAGRYLVNVTVDRNQPRLDYERFEWSPRAFTSSLPTAQIEARIDVNLNPLVVGTYGVIVLVIALIIGGIVLRMVRYRAATVNPLTGTPGIYRIDETLYARFETEPDSVALDQPIMALWYPVLPRRNEVTYKARSFVAADLIPLGIETFTISTNKRADLSQSKGFIADLKTGEGDPLRQEMVKYGQVVAVKRTGDGSRYYLANGLPERAPARDILKAAHQQGNES